MMRIRITQLSFEYPNRTFRLHIPELEIRSGEQIALVGPSGSGKTTLLRLMAGIFVPRSGEVVLDSLPLSSLDDAARREFRLRRIGFVFQDFQLIDYLDVTENIRLPFRIQPATHRNEEWDARVRELLNATGLVSLSKRPIEELSHGERQRVAICRALITRPGLILADEPTGNLDSVNKRQVLQLLLSQARDHRATLVMVTHDREMIDEFTRVVDFSDFYSHPSDA